MPASIYRSAEGAALIEALHEGALAALGVRYESLRVGTRSGGIHVLLVGPEDAPLP